MEAFGTDLYFGDRFISKVFVAPERDPHLLLGLFRARISVVSHSTSSERCPPQVILHTIADGGVWFKLVPQTTERLEWRELDMLHGACANEAKTAIVTLADGREVHLVAVLSRTRKGSMPCFWGYPCQAGQYATCKSMLNLRCLALVFDLDETLIVANTMKSFDDRLDGLEKRIRADADSERRKLLEQEALRYGRDRALLQQYCKSSEVTFEGRRYIAEMEVVPPIGGRGAAIQRPIVRLPNNVILTRINPAVPDTSVLLHIRPYWDELRAYMLAKGRKRFEPFVCTLSEREYALEMTRLLFTVGAAQGHPQACLLNWQDLPSRVVCVRPDNKKSLAGVFSTIKCHPNLALVVDDRLKVWEDRDQTRVHVVPPFSPYSAPGFETSLEVPVMSAARNVAGAARATYFKEVDGILMQQLGDLRFDTNPKTLPPQPDVARFIAAAVPVAPAEVHLENGLIGTANGTRDVARLESREVQLPQPSGWVRPAPESNKRKRAPAQQPNTKPRLL